jgi:hypothetical protein
VACIRADIGGVSESGRLRTFRQWMEGSRFAHGFKNGQLRSDEPYEFGLRGENGCDFLYGVLIYFPKSAAANWCSAFIPPGARRIPFSGPFGIYFQIPVKFQAIVLNDCILYRKPTADEVHKAELVAEGAREHAGPRSRRSIPAGSFEHLQYLREYIGVLREIAHTRDLGAYIFQHTLCGTSASMDSPVFRNCESWRMSFNMRPTLHSARICTGH